MARLKKMAFILLAVALPAAVFGLPTIGAQTSTQAPVTPAAVTSQVFAEAAPATVEEPVLALGVVTVEPGAAIADHVHPGTQIGTIAAGQLTYSVVTGDVRFRRAADAPDAALRTIQAGETVLLGEGDTVIENSGAIHHARNDGDVPVIIWLSTLFPAGAPRAEYVAATPVP